MTLLRQLLSLCALGFFLAGAAIPASPTATLAADIAPQPLADALSAFAVETGLQLIYVSGDVGEQKSKGAPKGLALADALSRLLEGSGLRFEFLNARTVRIFAAPANVSRAQYRMPGTAAPRVESRRQLPAPTLADVIVTASQREAPANSVPMSIDVWTAAAMEARGARNIVDISAMTPGVKFDYRPDVGAGFDTNIAIRGVSDGDGSTTGVFIDDTQLPAPGSWGAVFGRAYPLTFDLDRIEVLRGPQGTLLGEGALGGAIRFFVNQPDLTESSGFVRSEVAATARGESSYEVGAAAGGPLLVNVLGYRLSAWYRSDGGFVDRVDPFTGLTADENANRVLGKFVRGALTLAPSDRLRFTPSFTYQSIHTADSSTFYTYLSDPSAGRLDNGKLLRQPADDAFHLGSLKVDAKLGTADLSALTSYFERTGVAFVDATNTSEWGGWGNPLGPEYPASDDQTVSILFDDRQSVLSQEVRLTSADPEASLTWFAGAFYSRSSNHETVTTAETAIPAVGPVASVFAFDTHQSQLAGFGQIAARFAERLTASAGLRVARSDYTVRFAPPSDFHESTSATSVSPQFAITYRRDERSLFYFSAASGYRSGGINGPQPPECGEFPASYGPDTVWSYELGAKSSFARGRLQLNASVFHVDWLRPPIATVTEQSFGCRYVRKAGGASSDGFDLALQALISDSLKLDVSVAYADAHYTQTVRVGDTVVIASGDAIGTIPVVASPWSAAASLEYDFALGEGVMANFRLDDTFHSRNPGPFHSDIPGSPYYAPGRRPDPSTNTLDLRADFRWAAFDVALSVENALDSQPTIMRRNRAGQDTLFYATTFRPRTVGVTANWRF